MRIRTNSILLLSALLAVPALAVFDNQIPDAVSGAMGNITPTIGTGPTSLFGNPGISAGGAYRRSFNYADFDQMSAWAAYTDSKIGRACFTINSFSVTDLSTETKISLGYSRQLFSDIHTELGLGAVTNLHSLSYGKSVSGTELGSGMGVTLDLAAEAVIYNRTRVRVLAENLTATNMGVEGDIELPRAVTGAIFYSPYTATDMVFHIRREAGAEFTYGLGISASPHEIVVFRLGAATNPDRVTGGIGLRYKILRFDYAIKSHPVLPLSHTASLGVEIAR